MLVTAISWIIMSLLFILTGLIVRMIVDKIFGYRISAFSSLIMAGMAFCTVYSQIFSLFYKVGMAAFLVLLIISAAMLKEFKDAMHAWAGELRDFIRNNKIAAACLLVTLAVGLFWALYLTCLLPGEPEIPGGYDAQNYHIPSIRWTEEYGSVKGLGNLHSRFAFSSAYYCLQALFSFSWIYKYSLHNVNGYIWIYMFVFCLAGMWFVKNKRFAFSDVLRLLFLGRLINQGYWIGIPSTDFIPMCFTAYIFINWCDLNEAGEENDSAYGLLSIIGLIALSVKLSAAFVFLLVIRPLTGLIRDKKFLQCLKFVILSLIVTLPYLARNILSCGYLVFPVHSIDLFDPDWKMPASVIASTNTCIKLYGRAIWYSDSYLGATKSFIQWFPVWFKTTSPAIYKYIAVTDLVLAPVVIAILAVCLVKKKKMTYDKAVYFTAAAGFLAFMMSAPSARFGWIWFVTLPVLCLYTLAAPVLLKIKSLTFMRIVTAVLVMIAAVFFMNRDYREMIPFYGDAPLLKSHTLIEPRDYGRWGEDSGKYSLGGYDFYYYLSDDEDEKNHLNGYYGFPGTESKATLERIELRGSDLKDGFRPGSSEKKNMYDLYGNDISPEEASVMGID